MMGALPYFLHSKAYSRAETFGKYSTRTARRIVEENAPKWRNWVEDGATFSRCACSLFNVQTEANLEANHREVVGALLYEVTSM